MIVLGSIGRKHVQNRKKKQTRPQYNNKIKSKFIFIIALQLQNILIRSAQSSRFQGKDKLQK
jgi:hypothetical protein